jgi:hypothetical protein
MQHNLMPGGKGELAGDQQGAAAMKIPTISIRSRMLNYNSAMNESPGDRLNPRWEDCFETCRCIGLWPLRLQRSVCHEMAAFRIVSDEVCHHGVCGLYIDAIAARAGTCRTTVKNALREARTVQERRRRGQKSLTNLVRIVSPEWMAWPDRGQKIDHPGQRTERKRIQGNVGTVFP